MSLTHLVPAAELPRLGSAVSIVVPGGYSDDSSFGIDGFAHLREHLVLRAVDAAVAPGYVVRRSARTLRSTTEFDLVLYDAPDLDAATLLKTLLTNLPTDHRTDIPGIATELRDVQQIPSAAVADDELPRALGWSSGWGYGDPGQLEELNFEELSGLITHSWSGVEPFVSQVGFADRADRRPVCAGPSTGAADPSGIAFQQTAALAGPDRELHAAALGWIATYESPRWIKVLDDCLRYVMSYAVPRTRAAFPNLAVQLRLGQFGEGYTSADSELLVGWITTRHGTQRVRTVLSYAETLFRTARQLIETEAVPRAHLDMRTRLETLRQGSEVQQHTRWRSRAAYLGLGAHHPYTQYPPDVVCSDPASLVAVLAFLETTEPHLIVCPE